MELICRTSDTETAREIIASGWRRQDDREHYFENLWGSILLARFGDALSFSELSDRILPAWLGYAVEQRGNRPDDVEAYADFLDVTWKKLVVRPQSPDLERLTRHIRLKVYSGKELQIDYWSATDNPNGEKQGYIGAWGGRYRNPPVKDISEAFDLKKQRDAHRALQNELDQLIVREGKSGNPWLTTSFYHGSLAEVVALDARRWECWVAPVRSGNARGRYLLSACRGFYEKLCAALLAAFPQDGFALYEALEAHPSAHIVDHWFDLPVLLMDVFAAPESGETRQIRERLLDAATTDMDLFEIVLLSAWGAKMDWLHQRISEGLESSWEFECARALTLLGASDHETDRLRLAEWIKRHPDCWLRRVAELAHLRFTRNRWAHIWFERFLTRTDRTESWAAFQLFLRCVDRRFWLWQERALLTTAEQWKQDAFGFNVGDVLSACRENEKRLHDSLIGHQVRWGEYWPWMREYDQLD